MRQTYDEGRGFFRFRGVPHVFLRRKNFTPLLIDIENRPIFYRENEIGTNMALKNIVGNWEQGLLE